MHIYSSLQKSLTSALPSNHCYNNSEKRKKDKFKVDWDFDRKLILSSVGIACAVVNPPVGLAILGALFMGGGSMALDAVLK